MTTDLQLAVTETPEGNLKLASDIAAMNLLFAQQELSRRIIDPTITTKGLLDVAEHSFKVSGMAKKQEAKENAGSGFSIIINLPGGATATYGANTPQNAQEGPSVDDLVSEAVVVASEALPALEAPEWASAGNLSIDLDAALADL